MSLRPGWQRGGRVLLQHKDQAAHVPPVDHLDQLMRISHSGVGMEEFDYDSASSWRPSSLHWQFVAAIQYNGLFWTAFNIQLDNLYLLLSSHTHTWHLRHLQLPCHQVEIGDDRKRHEEGSWNEKWRLSDGGGGRDREASRHTKMTIIRIWIMCEHAQRGLRK